MTTKKQNSAVARIEPSSYALIKADEEALAVMAAAAAEGITMTSFPKIKVPSGGGNAWDIDGEPLKHFDGIILYHKPVKSFYRKAYGEDGQTNAPPDCSSIDMLTGVGDPGGECRLCPYNQYHKDGSGKECSDRTFLFILRPDSMLPYFLNAPPGSFGNRRDYTNTVLAGRGVWPWQVITRFALTQDKSKAGNITYSRITFENMGPLSADERTRIGDIRRTFVPGIERLINTPREWNSQEEEAS